MFCLEIESSKNKLITQPGFVNLLGFNDRNQSEIARARIAKASTNTTPDDSNKTVNVVHSFPVQDVVEILNRKVATHATLLKAFNTVHIEFKHLQNEHKYSYRQESL